MTREGATQGGDLHFHKLLAIGDALGNPHRLRIIAILAGGRSYVSEIARAVGLGRPVLYMHLQKLEAAGFVRSSLEPSAEGKPLRVYELQPIDLAITTDAIAQAVKAQAGKKERR